MKDWIELLQLFNDGQTSIPGRDFTDAQHAILEAMENSGLIEMDWDVVRDDDETSWDDEPIWIIRDKGRQYLRDNSGVSDD